MAQASYDGKLAVVIHRGRDLTKDNLLEKMDPYAVIEFNGRTVKTAVNKNGNKNPVWDERFEFELSAADGSMPIIFHVYDQHMLGDTLLGRVDLTLRRLFEETKDEKAGHEFDLIHPKKDKIISGYLTVAVQWAPRGGGYGGAPAPGYGAPAPGYGAPAPGYGAPAPGYGAAPGGGAGYGGGAGGAGYGGAGGVGGGAMGGGAMGAPLVAEEAALAAREAGLAERERELESREERDARLEREARGEGGEGGRHHHHHRRED